MMIRINKDVWANPDHVLYIEESVQGEHPLTTVCFEGDISLTIPLPANEVALALSAHMNVPAPRFAKWANGVPAEEMR